MQKKMLWGILLIAVALLLVGGGVFAYFSDTETASNNNFAAGTLDLQVGDQSPCNEQINVPALKPGDTGEPADWQMQNLGTIRGDLNISCGTITNSENTRLAQEIAAGDTTDGVGELGDNLTVAFWVDITDDGWSSGDYYLASNGSKISYQAGDVGLPAAAYDVLNHYSGLSWNGVQTNLPLGTIGYFKADYSLPLATNSQIQSDSCVFNLAFTLKQS